MGLTANVVPSTSSGGGTTVAAAVATNWITIGHNNSNYNAMYTVPSGKVFIGTLQAYHGIKINGTSGNNYYVGTTSGGKVTALPEGSVVYPSYSDGNWKYIQGVEIPAPTTHADSMVYTATGPNSH